MRERLIEYIDGLFSGAALNMRNAEIKEEILQNTLEHYDDLLSEGKSEQEAYDAVIQGIGDVRPLVEPEAPPFLPRQRRSPSRPRRRPPQTRRIRACAEPSAASGCCSRRSTF